MRQIFTSQRLETVEGVARLLEEAGIGTYISHPRSYRSKRRGQFSYSEPVPANQQPAVWVRKPEDQPRARELLREAGLLATTRSYSGLPTPATQALPSRFEEGGANRWAWRVHIGLLLLIAAVAVFIWLGTVQVGGVEVDFPKLTLVVEFAVMAAVLVWRPWGLLGRPQDAARTGGDPGEVVALYGTAALIGTPWADYHSLRTPHGHLGDSGSSCGGGGGDSGGDGGSSDGGGGCGGCGGGGD